jgi:hypothetical protein
MRATTVHAAQGLSQKRPLTAGPTAIGTSVASFATRNIIATFVDYSDIVLPGFTLSAVPSRSSRLAAAAVRRSIRPTSGLPATAAAAAALMPCSSSELTPLPPVLPPVKKVSSSCCYRHCKVTS